MSDTESTPRPEENLQNHDTVEGNIEDDKPSQAEGDVDDANEA